MKVLNTLLWHHADPNIPDNVGVLSIILEYDYCRIALCGGRQDGRTPLIEASEKGNDEIVRFLLEAHVSLNNQDAIVSYTIVWRFDVHL